MRVDPRERFTQTADRYDRYRPSYPGALIDWIIKTAGLSPGAPVADIGCGTGISSRLFAAQGYEVIGIDPNQETLSRARQAGGGARYLCGEASATGLGAAEVDL